MSENVMLDCFIKSEFWCQSIRNSLIQWVLWTYNWLTIQLAVGQAERWPDLLTCWCFIKWWWFTSLSSMYSLKDELLTASVHEWKDYSTSGDLSFSLSSKMDLERGIVKLLYWAIWVSLMCQKFCFGLVFQVKQVTFWPYDHWFCW